MWQVFAGNLNREDGILFNQVGASTENIAIPEFPAVGSAVTGLKLAFVTETSVGLEWLGLDSSEPVVAYQVEAFDSLDGTVKRVQEICHLGDTMAGPRVHNLTLSGLLEDVKLSFVIRSRSLHASGYDASPAVSISAAPSPPPQGRVAGLRATSVTENSILLSWLYTGTGASSICCAAR